MALSYRLSESTIYNIIKETCVAIVNTLAPIYLKTPSTVVWRNIAKGFYEDWQLPNCCGAVDGTHIAITSPTNSGSLFWNYKKFFSIVLLAVCNSRYEFTLVDVGAYGGESDGGILRRSSLSKYVCEGETLPPNKNLPGTNVSVPHFFVGDEAFRMTNSLMRPYPGKEMERKKRIFNYRLSRARRCIENAFGILVNRWQVFTKPIAFDPSETDKIILACVCLHNFLMARTQLLDEGDKKVFTNHSASDCEELASLEEHTNFTENADWEENIFEDNSDMQDDAIQALFVRDTLANYFLTPAGRVDWQDDYIDRGRIQDSEEEPALISE